MFTAECFAVFKECFRQALLILVARLDPTLKGRVTKRNFATYQGSNRVEGLCKIAFLFMGFNVTQLTNLY